MFDRFLPFWQALSQHPKFFWLNVMSDSIIALAYFSVPIALIYFAVKRRDFQYKRIFLLVGLFVLFCGLTHLADIYVLWVPNFLIQSVVKIITAVLSVAMVVVFLPLIPKTLRIPTQKLFEDSKRLASIVTNSRDAILSKSIDGKILTWNKTAEDIFQYSSDQMIGRSVYQIIPKSQYQLEEEALKRVRAGQIVDAYETLRIRKDGTEVPVSVLLSPVYGKNGRVAGISSIIRDQTLKHQTDMRLKEAANELRERNRELITVNKAKDEFIANLSHELRSPLNIILGYLQLLDNYEPGSREYRDSLEAIKRGANTQLRLVEDLLDMSRIVSGKFSLSIGSHNLDEIVDQAVKSVEFAARSKNITLEKKIETDQHTIVCDADRLRQILWNLLSNAVKFTSRDGHVTLSVKRDGVDFAFRVTDSGIGITPQDMPHIFDRLWQKSHQPSNGQSGGLGLGLNIARELAQAHGGTITAYSEGFGKGSTFSVRIPVQAIIPDEHVTSSNKLPLQNLNILVVDDSPDAVELIRLVLVKAGARVVTAANGAEALEYVRKNNIQFIISDINMPVMDGYTFMKNARQVENEQGSAKVRPAIALTARTGPGEKERAYKSGYQLHLIKPIQPSVLIEKVLAVLKQSG